MLKKLHCIKSYAFTIFNGVRIDIMGFIIIAERQKSHQTKTFSKSPYKIFEEL